MPGRGFSFCEQHSDGFGLIWSELPRDIYATNHQIDYRSESISGVPGAVPHGFNVKPREFKMVCGFENLSERQRDRIGAWLRAGRFGPLVMDHRPYCSYGVIVTSGVEWTETFPRLDPISGVYLLSGYLEFTLTAFVPYAYLLDGMTLDVAARQGMLRQAMDGTALLPEDCQPTVIGNHAFLHNAGNASAKLNIILIGKLGSEGVTIINHTSGQRLQIAGDDAAHTYHIDAVYGRVEELVGEETKLASHVHSGDYLELLPGAPMERNLRYHQTGNEILVQDYSPDVFDVGRFFFHGQWSRILAIEEKRLLLDCAPASGSGTGQLTQLNDIEVVRGADASLDITFDFKSTFY